MSGDIDLVVLRQLLFLLSTIFSSLASALNLFLIWDMRRWTGHTKLIALMSVYQLLYDIFFYSTVASTPGTSISDGATVVNEMSGCTSAFISNAMMMVVLYIVRYRRSVDVDGAMTWLHLTASIPALYLLALYSYSFGADNDVVRLLTNTSGCSTSLTL